MPQSAHPPLFYFECFDVKTGDEIEVAGDEALHLLRSRRLREGDRATLTNGHGLLMGIEIKDASIRKDALVAKVLRVTQVSKPQVTLTLAAAIPKGDRQLTLLDMATQLGVGRYIPLRCQRSATTFQERMRSRWQRTIREAAKQCRQVHFPEIDDECDICSLLSENTEGTLTVVADVNGDSVFDLAVDTTTLREVLILVGPEGGFSEQELAKIKQVNVKKLCLGNHIMRTETAAVSMLSTLNQLIIAPT